MTNSMMTSIAIGTFIGVLIQEKDIAIPTIFSVLIGIFVGYVTGRPISLMASLEGITAGIMGGMMGAMLGVMLSPQSAEVTVYFIDIIDFSISVLLLRIMDEEIKNHKEYSHKKNKVNLIVFIALLLLLVLLVNFNFKLF
ncbi:hypothetical protein [Neobacillus massiliamazoniensis]|nr:hypothetical protein [Neobacillus massiliamazoniensis]